MKCLVAVLLSLLLLLVLPTNAFVRPQTTPKREHYVLYAETPDQTRKPLIAGRLNSSPTQAQTLSLAIGIASSITPDSPSDVALFVPFKYLGAVQKAVGDKLIVGAEMMTPQDTGSMPPPPPSFLPGSQSWAPGSADQRKDSLLPKLEAMNIKWSMAGFSEERMLHDTNDSSIVNAHCLRMIANGMNVVLCIRETLEDFQQDRLGPILEAQLKKELAGVSAEGVMTKVTIVYEPAWANANANTNTTEERRLQESPEIAQATLHVCRRVLAIMYSPQVANATRILYGGAAIGDSVDAFMAMPDIDGALVNVPSVDAFKRIINFKAPPSGLRKLWSRVTKGKS